MPNQVAKLHTICQIKSNSSFVLGSTYKCKHNTSILALYKVMHKTITSALSQYQTKQKLDGFYPVIDSLLINYYDPMYDYQIKKKHKRIVFKGNAGEVL